MSKIKLRDYLDSLEARRFSYIIKSKEEVRAYTLTPDMLDQEIEVTDGSWPSKKEFKPAEGPYRAFMYLPENYRVIGTKYIGGGQDIIAEGIEDPDTARLLAASWDMWGILKNVSGKHGDGDPYCLPCSTCRKAIQEFMDRLEGKE